MAGTNDAIIAIGIGILLLVIFLFFLRVGRALVGR